MAAVAAAQAAALCDDQSKNQNRLSQASTNSGMSQKRARAHIGPWKLGRTLGRGSSGRVRLAKHTETGQLAAVKILPKSVIEPLVASGVPGDHQAVAGSLPYGLEREVIIMKLIEHPNIMGLYDVWENKGELYLVLEYIEGGELFDYLISRGRLSEREAVHYFRQICYGVDYCHQFNICHRDLKPENLLLDKHRDIKIADFGMAALETAGRMLETSCGSPHYASPEIVAGRTYHGAPSDIWSCGIILFALLTGHLPFDDDNIRKLLLKVQSGIYTMPSYLSREARDLISRMLLVSPDERITMEEIFAHPLLAKYPARRVPTANTDTVRMVNASRPCRSLADIDPEILKNLKTLWHRDSTEHITEKLLAPEPNAEKTFYCLLVRYGEIHGARSSPRRHSKRGSGAGASHIKSSPSMSRAKVSRHSRNASAHRSSNHSWNGATRRTPKSSSRYSVSSVNSKHRVMFRQRSTRSGSSQGSITDAPVNTTTEADRVTNEQDTEYEELAPEASTGPAPPSSAPVSEKPPRARSARAARKARVSGQTSAFADMLDMAFNFEDTRAVSATVRSDADAGAAAREPEQRSVSDPSNERKSQPFDFDFEEPQPVKVSQNQNPYILPMIFEEDRFADAVEEEVEIKVYKRREARPLPTQRLNHANENVLKQPGLVSNDSFYSYEPAPAAAAVQPPVRPAPAPPSTAGTRPPGPDAHDKVVRPAQDVTPKPAVPDAIPQRRIRRKPVSSPHPDTRLSADIFDQWVISGAPEPGTEKIHVLPDTPTGPADSEFAGPQSSGSVQQRDAARDNQGAEPLGSNTMSSPSAGADVRRPLANKSPNEMNVAPKGKRAQQRPMSILRRFTPRRRTKEAREAEAVPVQEFPVVSETRKEEPKQNWFFKMLNFSTLSQVSTAPKTLYSRCHEPELHRLIWTTLKDWERFGLYCVGDLTGTMFVTVTPRNVLRMRSSRFNVRTRQSVEGSLAEFAQEKGSRATFLRFVSELERALDRADALRVPKTMPQTMH